MAIRPRNALFTTWLLAALFGFFITGALLIASFRDVEPSGYWAGPALQSLAQSLFPSVDRVVVGPIWVFGTAIVFAIAAFLVVRTSVRSQTGGDPARRRFLTGAASGAGAAVLSVATLGGTAMARAFYGVGNDGKGWRPVFFDIFGGDVVKTHPEWKPQWKGSTIRAHRRMGRTEWSVSDIALGAAGVSGEEGTRVVRAAIERGVNYIDTSPDYAAAGSENAVGEAIQGHREKVFLATKFCTPLGNLPAGTSVAEYKAAVEGSLRRLRTDYVDLIHVHGCDSLERLLDPNVHLAFDELEREGKTRFLGFSSHTPNLVEVANAAIDSGRFDVMMLAYHHGIWPQMAEVIARASREADMGVVAMKTLKGAKHRGLSDFQPWADAYSQAALKWALDDPAVSSAIVSFRKPQHVDEYLHASGQPFGAEDAAVLRRYDDGIAGRYCAPHCGQCLDRCPHGVPIDDVLRHRMYFEDYGWEKEAMRGYALLDPKPDACVGCAAPCAGSCPLGVDIPTALREAHEMLTL